MTSLVKIPEDSGADFELSFEERLAPLLTIRNFDWKFLTPEKCVISIKKDNYKYTIVLMNTEDQFVVIHGAVDTTFNLRRQIRSHKLATGINSGISFGKILVDTESHTLDFRIAVSYTQWDDHIAHSLVERVDEAQETLGRYVPWFYSVNWGVVTVKGALALIQAPSTTSHQ